jgi:hypothetical protein
MARFDVAMKKQVEASHYDFAGHMDNESWTNVWHQLDEVMRAKPLSVLEIGPGPGLFKAVAAVYGLRVETFDLDPDLKLNHLGNVLDMPFMRGQFDAVCTFHMLERLQYEKALEAAAEMGRVAGGYLIQSSRH